MIFYGKQWDHFYTFSFLYFIYWLFLQRIDIVLFDLTWDEQQKFDNVAGKRKQTKGK